jgi:NADP-dependent 3-hydroxy acid dehydrogenase YdfG
MDSVFLIAGASTGIGAATARQAAVAGYRLVLAARSEDKLRSLVDELGGESTAIAVRCDVTEWADQVAMVERARDAFGRIDVVFANAGIGHPRGFEAGDPEAAKQTVLTNVYGIYATIRATAAALRATKGHLVITSSVAGRRALKGSLYSATKFAVTGMAEAARQDFNGTGVRTTLISPGMVETPGFSHDLDDTLTADDIARSIMFAVSQPPHVDVNEILIRPTAQET